MSEAEVFTITGNDASPYMTRVICGRFRIHIFWRGDNDPDCHDHPADFWTFPLVSYVEEFIGRDGRRDQRRVEAFRLHRRKAGFAHRVLFASSATGPRGRPIVTLVWWGKKRREWGFHTADGWVPWKRYFGLEPSPSKDSPK